MFSGSSSILSSIQNDYFQFFLLKHDNTINAIYGFRNSNTIYNNHLIIENFVSLYCDKTINHDDFMWGFYKSLSLFNKKIVAKYILIEDIVTILFLSKKLILIYYLHLIMHFFYIIILINQFQMIKLC